MATSVRPIELARTTGPMGGGRSWTACGLATHRRTRAALRFSASGRGWWVFGGIWGIGGEGTLLSRRARPHSHASVAPFTHHSGSDVQREPDATRTPDADANLMQASSAAE